MLKKGKLLFVLKHPQILLHNNMAELAARAKVRKKDVSFHTMSQLGTNLKDTFLTLNQTAAKLNVSTYKYISDKLKNTYERTSLADLISARTNSS